MKFKIGDKVRVVKDYQLAKKGMTGKVAAFGPNDEWPGIDFGPGFVDGHDLHGAIKIDTGYYVPPDYLELLPEEVREIKPGSKWRNVHGEVSVDFSTDWEVFAGGMYYRPSLFRATHEWVSDPVETPKVGSWFKEKRGDILRVVHHIDHEGLIHTYGFGDRHTYYDPSELAVVFEPCEPPPLVKALDKLELAVTGFVDSDYEAKALVSEWRAIKAKMGVKA